MEDTRLPKKCVMFGELVGGAGCVGGQKKEWMGCFLDDIRTFGSNAYQWTTGAQDEGKWTAEKGAGRFMGEMDRCRESQGWTTRRTVLICPNLTGSTKERIAQSKRARAGSPAIIA